MAIAETATVGRVVVRGWTLRLLLLGAVAPGCTNQLPRALSAPTLRCRTWSEEPTASPTFDAAGVVLADPDRDTDQGCLLGTTGRVACWGHNTLRLPSVHLYGLLVGGARATWDQPAIVRGLPTITALAGRDGVLCGLGEEGDVYCWGHDNSCGPQYVGTVSSGAVGIAVTRWGVQVLGSDGRVRKVAWISETDVTPWPQHNVVAGLPPLTEIQGDDITCGLDAHGALYCWDFEREPTARDFYTQFAVTGSVVCGLGRDATATSCGKFGPKLETRGMGPIFAMTHGCVQSNAGAVRCQISAEQRSLDETAIAIAETEHGRICTIDTAGTVRCHVTQLTHGTESSPKIIATAPR